MENKTTSSPAPDGLSNLNFAARNLFFITGSLLFASVFLLKNGMYVEYTKPSLFILDLPFLFFAVIYLSSSANIIASEREVFKSFVNFFLFAFFIVILFFHFAFPDLI